MDNVKIPDEALEAACRAFTEIMLDVAPEGAIEAACLAMLKNWPGVEHQTPDGWSNKPHIILPLPTEKETSA